MTKKEYSKKVKEVALSQIVFGSYPDKDTNKKENNKNTVLSYYDNNKSNS